MQTYTGLPKLLKRCWVAACALCLVAAPGYAQDVAIFQTEEVPYIQASDLQHVTLHRDSARGKNESDESVVGQSSAFAEVVSASSLKEVYRLVGSPKCHRPS